MEAIEIKRVIDRIGIPTLRTSVEIMQKNLEKKLPLSCLGIECADCPLDSEDDDISCVENCPREKLPRLLDRLEDEMDKMEAMEVQS